MSTNTGEDFDQSLGDGVDMNVFLQVLDIDEDDRDFSSGLVFGFFEQAENAFEQMDLAISEEDIQEVSKFAHLLRGSSETLGLLKVQTGCEKLQHYGNNEDLDGSPEPDSELCLKRIVETLKDVKADYADVKMVLENFYKDL